MLSGLPCSRVQKQRHELLRVCRFLFDVPFELNILTSSDLAFPSTIINALDISARSRDAALRDLTKAKFKVCKHLM